MTKLTVRGAVRALCVGAGMLSLAACVYAPPPGPYAYAPAPGYAAPAPGYYAAPAYAYVPPVSIGLGFGGGGYWGGGRRGYWR
jgi:hypothetical protein